MKTYYTNIESDSREFRLNLKELWDYRDLVLLLTKKTFTLSYKQTILGPAWIIINPLLSSMMYIVIFGVIAGISTNGIPQMLFYLISTTFWTLFASSLTSNAYTFIHNAHIFGKVYFPRLVVPIAVVISNLLRFAIQAGLFVVLYLYFFFNGADIAMNWAILLTPVFIVMLAGLGLGFGILISSLTTKYRDFTILFTFVVQLWMYATPIVYPLSMVADGTLRTLILANPMTSIIEAFKYATLGQGYFSWFALGYSFLFMSVLLLFSIVIFNKVQRNFMDTV